MNFEPYILIAFLAALLMGVYSVALKMLVRYRICSPLLVTIGYCIGAGLICGIAMLALGLSWDPGNVKLFAGAIVTTLCAHLFLALALQEADASTVVPLLGLKIPFTAVLAFAFLGESFGQEIYIAVAISGGAVILFGLGRPAAAMGAKSNKPAVGIILAMVSAASYSALDIISKKLLGYMEPLRLILLMHTVVAVPCIALFLLPRFRQYKIGAVDLAGFVFCGGVLTAGVVLFITSINISGNVTLPNIILATRGFIVLVIGLLMGRFMSIPIEKQRPAIYVLRTIATVMLFTALVMILRN